MIKQTLTYENYNGVEVTKDFYFHLTKADMIELAIDGDFETRMRKAIRNEDKLTIFREFKQLVFLAVGVRSEDGESFAKPEMFREAFMTSPAFDKLIDHLFSSEDKAAAFITGLLPAGAQEAALKELDKKPGELPAPDPFKDIPQWVTDNRVPTAEEFNAANDDFKKLAFQRQLTQKS